MSMMRLVLLVAFVVVGLAGSVAAQSVQSPSGEATYQRRCATCHEKPADGRTPSRETLQAMTATRILRTMDFGAMMTIAYQLNREERDAVARFLGRPDAEAPPAPAAFCRDRSVSLDAANTPSWNGWSPSRDNARYAPAALAGLTADMVPRLKLKWAFGFDGDISAFSQPTVIGRQVFIGSAGGVVHALQADTGCLQWTFQANGPIRSAIVAAPVDGRHLLLFGDLTGWFYALDASTGKQIWRQRPDPHEAVRLSAPPVVHDGVAYIPVASWEESRSLNPEYPCCTFRGSVVALRVRDGSQVWKAYTIPTEAQPTGKTPVGTPTLGPSGVGVWGSPTLDVKRRRLYVTTGTNYSLPATRSWRWISTPAASSGRSRCCRTTSITQGARRRRKDPRVPRATVRTTTSDRRRFS